MSLFIKSKVLSRVVAKKESMLPTFDFLCSVVATAQQQAHATIQHASNQTKPEEATTRTAKQEEATAALLVALDSRNVGDIAEALERWAGDADSATVARVRAHRKGLKHEQRKHKRKAERAEKELTDAMQAGTDVAALEMAIARAQQHDTLNALVDAAKDRLEQAKIEQRAMQKEASLEDMENEFIALAMNPSAANLDDMGANQTDEKLCIVCEDLVRQVRYSRTATQVSPCAVQVACVPCGHICVCQDCGNRLEAMLIAECPICRVGIQSLLKVYQV